MNISNNGNYSGVNSITLQLNNVPSSWYGYKFRCVADSIISNEFSLRFSTTWLGSVSTAWEDPLNWSCGLPDANTDVYINFGSVVLSSNAFCRNLLVGEGAALNIIQGFQLIISH